MAEAKLIPLVVVPEGNRAVPASKERRFKVLVPDDGVVVLVGVMSKPPMVTPDPGLLLVNDKAWALEAAPLTNVCEICPTPDDKVRLEPEVSVIPVAPVIAPAEVMAIVGVLRKLV